MAVLCSGGADANGYCYSVQLALEGVPYQKPRHAVGDDTVGVDLGPSTIAIVPQQEMPRLELLCADLAPDAETIRRLQRQMERQRRANNPANYDERGRIKKQGKHRLKWNYSQRYLRTRRRRATRERRLAAHRKSLHGRLVHEIVALGNTIITEKLSYRAWQKQFGKSVNLRAPGMFIELLRRTVGSTGGILVEISTRSAKLSQFCHGCGAFVKKPLSQRWHECACGISAQRNLYSAFLAAYLDPADVIPSRARYQPYWEGVEPRLRAACEQAIQRANEGHYLPRSFGIPGGRARLPESPGQPFLESEPSLREGLLEAEPESLEPPGLCPERSQTQEVTGSNSVPVRRFGG